MLDPPVGDQTDKKNPLPLSAQHGMRDAEAPMIGDQDPWQIRCRQPPSRSAVGVQIACQTTTFGRQQARQV